MAGKDNGCILADMLLPGDHAAMASCTGPYAYGGGAHRQCC